MYNSTSELTRDGVQCLVFDDIKRDRCSTSYYVPIGDTTFFVLFQQIMDRFGVQNRTFLANGEFGHHFQEVRVFTTRETAVSSATTHQ